MSAPQARGSRRAWSRASRLPGTSTAPRCSVSASGPVAVVRWASPRGSGSPAAPRRRRRACGSDGRVGRHAPSSSHPASGPLGRGTASTVVRSPWPGRAARHPPIGSSRSRPRAQPLPQRQCPHSWSPSSAPPRRARPTSPSSSPSGSAARSSTPTRCSSTAAWTSAPPSCPRRAPRHPAPPARHPRRHRAAAVAEYQGWARAAVADMRGRGADAGAGRRLRAVRAGRARPVRVPRHRPGGPRAAGGRARRVGAGRAARAAGRARPEAAARILPDNGRRIVRALEVIEITGRPVHRVAAAAEYADPRTCSSASTSTGPTLDARIAQRVDADVRRRACRRGRAAARRGPGGRPHGSRRARLPRGDGVPRRAS